MVYLAQYDEKQQLSGFTDEGERFFPLEYKTELEALVALNKATITYKTQAELDALAVTNAKVTVVSKRQAVRALAQSNLLTTVLDAIASSTDEALKLDWEYATDIRRDWTGLSTLAQSIGLTDTQLDDLFVLASTL